MTGAVNLSMHTIYADTFTACAVNMAYVFGVCAFGTLLYRFGVKLKP